MGELWISPRIAQIDTESEAMPVWLTGNCCGAPGGMTGARRMGERWGVYSSSGASSTPLLRRRAVRPSMSVVTDSRVARVLTLRKGYSEPMTTA